MAEEIWAREFGEGWIDYIELVKQPGVYFRIEINCSAQMEDRRFGIGSSTIWGGGEKHCEKIGEGIDRDEGRRVRRERERPQREDSYFSVRYFKREYLGRCSFGDWQLQNWG